MTGWAASTATSSPSRVPSRVLDQDLGIGAINGIAHVTQDDLENTYNSCFEADNQKNCTYQP